MNIVNGSTFVKGGVLFALLAIIVGTSIYGLNKKESESKISQAKTEIRNVAVVTTVEKTELKKEKPKVLAKNKEKVKLKPNHLYVKSDEEITKEFQQKKIQERRMYKMREMRAKRLMERKFQKIRNRKKEENA